MNSITIKNEGGKTDEHGEDFLILKNEVDKVSGLMNDALAAFINTVDKRFTKIEALLTAAGNA